MSPKDPVFESLKLVAEQLKSDYEKNEDMEWLGHDLAWIRTRPSANIGKIGRIFVQHLCEINELRVDPVGYSLKVPGKSGKIVQCKFSTGWSGGGFKFEQLRNENYAAAFCLGITPDTVYAWAIPKGQIFDSKGVMLLKDGLKPQHKGKGGKDTAWITVDIQSIPDWMSEYGGTVSQAMASLKLILASD